MKKSIIITLLLLLTIAGLHAQTIYVQKKSEKIVVTPGVEKTLLKSIEQGKAYLIDVRTPRNTVSIILNMLQISISDRLILLARSKSWIKTNLFICTVIRATAAAGLPILCKRWATI